MIEALLGKATVAAASNVTFEGLSLTATVHFYEGMEVVIPGVPRKVPITPEIRELHAKLVRLVEIEVCKMVGATTPAETPATETPAAPPVFTSPLEKASPGGVNVPSINDFLEDAK